MKKIRKKELKKRACYYVLGMFMLAVTMISLNSNSVAAQSQKSDAKYNKACEEALSVIQVMNKDKLDVEVGDIYNVVDVNGDLEGYSLGYFVGEKPYGYAIFCIES